MSIRFKFIIINFILIVITVGPLVFFTLRTTEFKLGMRDIPGVEKAIENAVIYSPEGPAKDQALDALRKYRQMKALKAPLKREFIAFTILLSLFIIFFSTAVTVFLTLRVTKPLRKLEVAAKKLAQGEFPKIEGVHTKDEVGNLVETFNSMSLALKESKKKLVIAEREAAWKDAARAVAHEIRNPLTPIKLATERLKEKARLKRDDINKTILETTEMILEEIENLDGIARSFSDFAKLPEPVRKMDNLNEVLREVVYLYSEYEGVQIRHQFDEAIPQILFDRDRIKQVLINIVKNGIEAIDGNGTILITSKVNIPEGKVEISIRDNGPGLNVDLSLLFVPHFTTKEKGSGLGLAISKRIIEAHNGKIEARSEEGKGTEFIITLPLEKVE